MADPSQRIDKWLFFARVVKSRSLAQKLVLSGAVRLNREKIDNPAQAVRPGDALTISLGSTVRVLKIEACGTRRGPAPEAQTLYDDISSLRRQADPAGLAQQGAEEPSKPGDDRRRPSSDAHDRSRLE